MSKAEALQTGYHLLREDGGRQAALTYLSEAGYHVGSSGSASSSQSKDSSRAESIEGEAPTIYSARENPLTDAEGFQQTAEQEGIDNLSHGEISRVAHRQLRYGWEPTWEWFEEQYGSEFDPVVAWTQFRSIVEENSYSKYDHVEVPKKPT